MRLRDLDDRVLGKRRAPEEIEPYPEEQAAPARQRGDGLKKVLTVVAVVSRVVFLLLALAVALGVLFLLVPTNADNPIVEGTLSVADWAAGPFRDVFAADDAETELVVNYAVAAGVFLLAAALVRKLPDLAR